MGCVSSHSNCFKRFGTSSTIEEPNQVLHGVEGRDCARRVGSLRPCPPMERGRERERERERESVCVCVCVSSCLVRSNCLCSVQLDEFSHSTCSLKMPDAVRCPPPVSRIALAVKQLLKKANTRAASTKVRGARKCVCVCMHV